MNFYLENNLLLYLFTYLLLPLVVLFNFSTYKKGSNCEDYLNINVTNQIKGICAIIIILHHMSQQMKTPGLMAPFVQAGYLAVSIFFFLSGYGLMMSQLNKKTNY